MAQYKKELHGEREYHASLNALMTQHAILFQREVDGLTNPQIHSLKALCSNVPPVQRGGNHENIPSRNIRKCQSHQRIACEQIDV
ncbi:MAG: hypothetical protein HYZ34_03005 [Ignavibacteriae bacterium]|nr:hypothetical protein [Ignavibacteriota bacterium]